MSGTGQSSPEQFNQASWLLAGLSVAADWLGSNTRWFRYRKPEWSLVEYWDSIAQVDARRVVDESGLMGARPSFFPGFESVFGDGKRPTALQSWAEQVEIFKGPQLFVLEELTGGGKTEAALTLAARLMSAGHAQGVYVALPTMATADAMFDRLRGKGLWRRLFADDTASLALAHSADWLKLKLEEANRSDAGYGQDEELSASRHCTAWLSDNRKKALLADFGVGTVDQALLSVLPVRHQSLRLFGLSTKVLIVDEVHACDCYMGELLARLLYFHARLGGSAVLLSATLPKAQRAHYVRAFAQGAGFIEHEPHVDSYPLATHLSATSLTETPLPARREAARRVTVHTLGDEDAALA